MVDTVKNLRALEDKDIIIITTNQQIGWGRGFDSALRHIKRHHPALRRKADRERVLGDNVRIGALLFSADEALKRGKNGLVEALQGLENEAAQVGDFNLAVGIRCICKVGLLMSDEILFRLNYWK